MSADTISIMKAPTKKPTARVVKTVARAVGRVRQRTKYEINTQEVIAFVKHNLWNMDFRLELQGNGVNICPANFYSSIPTIMEVNDSWEYKQELPFMIPELYPQDILNKTLDALIEICSSFDEIDINDYIESGYFNNDQYSYSDALSYYAMIKAKKPSTIVEIGSGYSTLIALKALRENGKGKLICIEPYPSDLLKKLSKEPEITLLKTKVENLDILEISDMLLHGDFLFIDSTHTVKAGSDTLFIYFKLLPLLKKKLFIHIHDIFLPFAMPKSWQVDQQIFWTEQYLVLALLMDTEHNKMIYGSSYHNHFNKERLELLSCGQENRTGGSSIWIERN